MLVAIDHVIEATGRRRQRVTHQTDKAQHRIALLARAEMPGLRRGAQIGFVPDAGEEREPLRVVGVRSGGGERRRPSGHAAPRRRDDQQPNTRGGGMECAKSSYMPALTTRLLLALLHRCRAEHGTRQPRIRQQWLQRRPRQVLLGVYS